MIYLITHGEHSDYCITSLVRGPDRLDIKKLMYDWAVKKFGPEPTTKGLHYPSEEWYEASQAQHRWRDQFNSKKVFNEFLKEHGLKKIEYQGVSQDLFHIYDWSD